MKITQYPIPSDQYIRTETEKTQLFLHHTAGNPNPFGTFNWWTSTASRIATCIVIGGKPSRKRDQWKDGEIVQGFSSKYWAYHLGLKKAIFKAYDLPYKPLDKTSIAVELCNWGQLEMDDDGRFRTYVDSEVPEQEVVQLDMPFKGYTYYHAYTDAQLDSLYELIVYWKDRYSLPLFYSEELWSVSRNALAGMPGLYCHNSVRKDKVDLSPQPKLIRMLQSI